MDVTAPLAAIGLALVATLVVLIRRRRKEEARLRTELEPGQHSCKHQVRGHLKCAVPSCPAGVPGKTYRVLVRGNNGKRARFEFRRVCLGAGEWMWQPTGKVRGA